MELTQILIGIIGIFLILLFVKSFSKKEFCVICSSVTLTWIGLLVLYFYGYFMDKMIIAIMMGMTSLGIYYTWENKVKKNKTIFRLPLILTLIFIVYSVLEIFILNSFLFLIGLWFVFGLIYLFRENSSFRNFSNKLIECCKKW